jgi:ubiquinone/menaquinone biosynthesis C-methylase UbiE
MKRSEEPDGTGCTPPVDNSEQLSRVYSDETWRVYDLLDKSLAPRGHDSLYDIAGEYLESGCSVLDAGCRDAAHLIQLVQRYQVTGVGVDPVEIHIDRARERVKETNAGESIEVFTGVIQDLPFPDGYFDFIWCRDVLEQVDDLDGALREAARVLNPDGHMLVYTTFATDRLSAQENEMMNRHLGNVPANLVERNVEDAFARAALAIERKEVVGTEWREYAEEQTRPASRALLRLSRLRRQREALEEDFGRDIYEHVEANLHWEVFQFLGKLVPTIYILKGRA